MFTSDQAQATCFSDFQKKKNLSFFPRVSVQEVESLGGHFATLCREFDFYEVKKGKYFYTFNHFYGENSSKRAKQHKSTTMTPILPE